MEVFIENFYSFEYTGIAVDEEENEIVFKVLSFDLQPKMEGSDKGEYNSGRL